MTGKDWIEIAQTAGGWGVAAIEFYIIKWLVGQIKDRDVRIYKLLDKQNEILLAIEERRRVG